MNDEERDRPSTHGKLLGQALSLIEKIGRRDMPFEMPPMCATCAFREGSMPNQMAATGLDAMRTMMGVDPDRFGCHHGLEDGQPTRVCVGYIAARNAPWSAMMEIIGEATKRLDAMDKSSADEVRIAFDAWVKKVDPEGTMDDYKLARELMKETA